MTTPRSYCRKLQNGLNLKLLADIVVLCATAGAAWAVLKSEVKRHEERISEVRQTIVPYSQLPERLRSIEDQLKMNHDEYKDSRNRIDSHDKILSAQAQVLENLNDTLKEIKQDMREQRK